MIVVKCDVCRKMCSGYEAENAIKVVIQKADAHVQYECCSDKCAQELFRKLCQNWLGDNQSGNRCNCGDDARYSEN